MQTPLNEKLLLVIIILFKCLPTFALDAYSPAIPEIAAYFHVEQTSILVTFTTYYAGFALGILIWGALSDIFGRKKILQLGALLYVISSIICPFSSSLSQLIIARFGQGLGDAACATVAVAILRDCYSGPALLKITSSIGSFALIAPIIAPTIGVSLISLTNEWQSVFHFLTFYGVILLIASCFLHETIHPTQVITNISGAFKYYYVHARNKPFIALSMASALICGAALSFISSSAIIYLKIFQLGKWEYVFLFGLNAIVIILANFIVKRIADLFSNVQITMFSLISCLIIFFAGYFMMRNGHESIVVFFTVMSLATFFMSICMSTVGVMAISSVHESFGTATSIKNFLAIFCGGIVNFVITRFSYSHLIEYLILQQLCLLLIAVIIILPKLSKMDTSKGSD